MNYRKDIFDALTQDNDIGALVGTNVFPNVADHSAVVPYVVYQTISTGGETAHDGSRESEFPLIQITAWDQTHAGAGALADLIVNLLEGASFGDSDITFIFSNRLGNYDETERLFGEVIELQGISNRNQ